MPDEPRAHDIDTPDGGRLRVYDCGPPTPPDRPAIVVHHGTPSSGRPMAVAAESAQRRGLRLIGYDRPGYGGSTAQPGRNVGDAARDVATILDALGVDRFATYGFSGGGPHALACAALLPDRCAAAASVAGVAPCDAAGIDWTAGMGEGNLAEFGAARHGRARLLDHVTRDAREIAAIGGPDLAEAMRPHLSDVDARALTGDVAADLHGAMAVGLEPGVDGWVDDDYAFLGPWCFDVGAIQVPVLVWQGDQDLMVPEAHGRWLHQHVAGAEGGVLEGEGHITLVVNRVDDVPAWLAERLA